MKILRILLLSALALCTGLGVLFIVFYTNLSFFSQKTPRLMEWWTSWERAKYKKEVKEVAPKSRIDTVTIHSDLLGVERTFLVYVPDGYGKIPSRRYPVLYLLHGSPGAKEDWLVNADLQSQLDELIAARTIPPLLVVMPDGNGPTIIDSEYLDATKIVQPMESHFVKELVPYIDLHYATLADRRFRALGGLSSGAYGAVNIGLRHPDLFAVMLSHSGYFMNHEWATRELVGKNTVAWHANNPAEYLASRQLDPDTALYIEVGKVDFPSFVKGNQDFAALLTASHIEHVYTESNGVHSWSTWRVVIRQSLAYMASKWWQWGLSEVQ
jgi:enterochelin esterase-like enzyme